MDHLVLPNSNGHLWTKFEKRFLWFFSWLQLWKSEKTCTLDHRVTFSDPFLVSFLRNIVLWLLCSVSPIDSLIASTFSDNHLDRFTISDFENLRALSFWNSEKSYSLPEFMFLIISLSIPVLKIWEIQRYFSWTSKFLISFFLLILSFSAKKFFA